MSVQSLSATSAAHCSFMGIYDQSIKLFHHHGTRHQVVDIMNCFSAHIDKVDRNWKHIKKTSPSRMTVAPLNVKLVLNVKSAAKY